MIIPQECIDEAWSEYRYPRPASDEPHPNSGVAAYRFARAVLVIQEWLSKLETPGLPPTPWLTTTATVLRDVTRRTDWRAHNQAILKIIGKPSTIEQRRVTVSAQRSTAVLAAVLRELADLNAPLTPEVLRALADKVEQLPG